MLTGVKDGKIQNLTGSLSELDCVRGARGASCSLRSREPGVTFGASPARKIALAIRIEDDTGMWLASPSGDINIIVRSSEARYEHASLSAAGEPVRFLQKFCIGSASFE
jgi:hypothetical protein